MISDNSARASLETTVLTVCQPSRFPLVLEAKYELVKIWNLKHGVPRYSYTFICAFVTAIVGRKSTVL